jgi:hypothetical protein
VNPTDHVVAALLVSEWCVDAVGQFCPSCGGQSPRAFDQDLAVREDNGLAPRPGVRRDHGPDCDHDLALSGLGYPDGPSRDRARAALTETIPAPPPDCS